MSDTTQAPAKPRRGFTAASRAKAQATRAAKRAAKGAAPKAERPAAGEFAGLSAADCCKACGPDGCVISGKAYCAHPRKGGLQGSEMHERAAVERFARAKTALA